MSFYKQVFVTMTRAKNCFGKLRCEMVSTIKKKNENVVLLFLGGVISRVVRKVFQDKGNDEKLDR